MSFYSTIGNAFWTHSPYGSLVARVNKLNHHFEALHQCNESNKKESSSNALHADSSPTWPWNSLLSHDLEGSRCLQCVEMFNNKVPQGSVGYGHCAVWTPCISAAETPYMTSKVVYIQTMKWLSGTDFILFIIVEQRNKGHIILTIVFTNKCANCLPLAHWVNKIVSQAFDFIYVYPLKFQWNPRGMLGKLANTTVNSH